MSGGRKNLRRIRPTPLRARSSEHIRQAVAALPLAQREALVLFQYEDLSLDEIANILAVDGSIVHRGTCSCAAASPAGD
jgi:DNA-directed RNA polymerase specialized sigma24 family protein